MSHAATHADSPFELAGARVLVTGVCGLVGREVAAQLTAHGALVRGIDLREAPATPLSDGFVRGDLADAGACSRACEGVSAVVHTAARQYGQDTSRWHREEFFAANGAMTRALVDAARGQRVARLVYLSSDMVYGLPPGRALRESDAPAPIGPYGRSKLAGEAIAAAARSAEMKVTLLRPRLIVGRGRLGVLKKLFDRVRAGAAIPMIGAGRNRYQMIGVGDVAAACLAALERGPNDCFNIGSADPPPIRALLGELIRRAGSSSRLIVAPVGLANAALWLLEGCGRSPLAPEQFRIASVDYVLDISKSSTQLAWRPRQSDVDMLWEAYESYVRATGAAPAGEQTAHAAVGAMKI